MYLRSAALKHWGCHENLAVAFHDGINVCVGRNGAGKSTLYQAIVTALTVKHGSKQADLSRFQSWGGDGFGPTATLDIVRDDGAWVLEKTYLHAPRCVLKRAPGGSTPQSFNGAKAEQELDRWLEGDGAAGRLILTLWSRQDAPIEYQEIPGAKSSSLGTLLEKAIARAAQPEAAGPFGTLKKKFADEYEARFTPEFKRIKKGSDLDKATLGRDEARATLDALLQKRADLAGKVETLRARAGRHDDECRDRAEFRRRKADREAARRDYGDKAAALKRAEDKAAGSRAEHDALKLDHDRLTLAEDQLAATGAKLAGLAPTLAEAKVGRDRAEEALRAARDRSQRAREMLDELGGAFERKRQVAEAAEALETRRAAEDAARADSDRARSALAEAEARSAAAVERAEQASRGLAAALRSRLRRDFLAAEQARQAAEADHRLALAADLAARREALRDRLDKVGDLSTRLDAIGEEDDGPLPSAADRDALAAEEGRLIHLEGAIEGDALTARLVAEAPITVQLAGDGEAATRHELAAGRAIEGRGVATFTIAIEGVGRIEIGRTSVDPADRLERLRNGREALTSKLAGWGVADLAGLDGRLRRAEERRNALERRSLLLGGRSVAELAADLAALDGDLRALGVEADDPPPPPPPGPGLKELERRANAAYLASEKARSASEGAPGEGDDPAETPADPDESRKLDEAAKRAVASSARDAQRAAIDAARAEAALTAAIHQRAEAAGRVAEETHGGDSDLFLTEMNLKISRLRANLEWIGFPYRRGETQASIQLARDDLDKATRDAQAEFERARERWTAADADHRLTAQARDLQSAAVEELRRAPELDGDARGRRERLRHRESLATRAEAEARVLRDALPPDPEADGEAFERDALEAEERCHQGDVALEGLRAEIAVHGADGLDSRVALAEEKLARLEARVAESRRDASAWALLHHLLAEVEAEQSKNVAARLQALAAPRVSHLTAGSVGEAIFDPKNLAPASARVPGLASSPGLDQFSRGTREQVALACRLQIGVLLSEERTRHVLLLDDPLAHTDTRRHQAALDMFASLRDKLQFIIFTCHEDRYRPLGDAAKFHAIG